MIEGEIWLVGWDIPICWRRDADGRCQLAEVTAERDELSRRLEETDATTVPRAQHEALLAAYRGALEALVAGIEDAGPVTCGACVNRHTGNTNCIHAQIVTARLGRARTVLGEGKKS